MGEAEKTDTDLNRITGEIVDSGLKVHVALGPGLLESAYQACLAYELRERGLEVDTQVLLPVRYGEIELEAGYRIDLLVNDCVVVELKAVEAVTSLHKAQLLSYLRMSGHKVGLLLNFNVPGFRDGITRLANGI